MKLKNVIGGVSQSSAFGPVLFISYINELPRAIIAMLFLFADDAKLMERLFLQLHITSFKVISTDSSNGLRNWI